MGQYLSTPVTVPDDGGDTKCDRETFVVISGSTKFKNEIEQKAASLSWQGKIVLRPEVYSHFDNKDISEADEAFLDALHKRKISISSEMYVINVGGYIESSTHKEIAFAESIGVPIQYLEPPESGASNLE